MMVIPGKRKLIESYEGCRDLMLCIGCRFFIEDAVYTCKNTHAHCGDCLATQPICKMCNSVVQIRNHIIESLRESIQFACKWEHCLERFPLSALHEHERECLHKQIHCGICKGVTYYSADSITSHVIDTHKIVFDNVHESYGMTMPLSYVKGKNGKIIGLHFKQRRIIVKFIYNKRLDRLYIGCQTLEPQKFNISIDLNGKVVVKNLFGGEFTLFFRKKYHKLSKYISLSFF